MEDYQIFYAEVCTGCEAHAWNTRHDRAKYQKFYTDLEDALVNEVPQVKIIQNHNGKQPRLGAFEVHCVFRGFEILFYSKIKSREWPHAGSLAGRIRNFIEDVENEQAASFLQDKYTTPGKSSRRKSVSPSRTNNSSIGFIASQSYVSMQQTRQKSQSVEEIKRVEPQGNAAPMQSKQIEPIKEEQPKAAEPTPEKVNPMSQAEREFKEVSSDGYNIYLEDMKAYLTKNFGEVSDEQVKAVFVEATGNQRFRMDFATFQHEKQMFRSYLGK